MPNDCENNLTLKFKTKEECDRFADKYLQNDYFDFDIVIPEPRIKKECPEKYIYDPDRDSIQTIPGRKWFNWYKWHLDKWDTKWNSYENIIEKEEKEINIYFSTAWSPCINVIRELIKQNPNVKIQYTYYECGMGFAGGYDKNLTSEKEIKGGFYDVPYDNTPVWRAWLVQNGYEDQEYFDELDAEEEENDDE